MSADLKEQLRQGEAAALYAAQKYSHYAHFAREWKEEWELIAANNQALRDALRPGPPVMDKPITLELVEETDADNESILTLAYSASRAMEAVFARVEMRLACRARRREATR